MATMVTDSFGPYTEKMADITLSRSPPLEVPCFGVFKTQFAHSLPTWCTYGNKDGRK